MEIKTKLINVGNIRNDKGRETTIHLDGWLDFEPFQPFVGKDITLKITKYSERRSLDANAYLWVLCTKLAEVLKTSKDEVYEEFIQRYGYVDEPPISISVLASVDMSKIDGHWKYLKDSSDGRFKAYMRLRGTSEYTSKEMAHFLDMVVQECKEQGIETLPSEELERMKSMWKQED